MCIVHTAFHIQLFLVLFAVACTKPWLLSYLFPNIMCLWIIIFSRKMWDSCRWKVDKGWQILCIYSVKRQCIMISDRVPAYGKLLQKSAQQIKYNTAQSTTFSYRRSMFAHYAGQELLRNFVRHFYFQTALLTSCESCTPKIFFHATALHWVSMN